LKITPNQLPLFKIIIFRSKLQPPEGAIGSFIGLMEVAGESGICFNPGGPDLLAYSIPVVSVCRTSYPVNHQNSPNNPS
jgi:hypothetical protein